MNFNLNFSPNDSPTIRTRTLTREQYAREFGKPAPSHLRHIKVLFPMMHWRTNE